MRIIKKIFFQMTEYFRRLHY